MSKQTTLKNITIRHLYVLDKKSKQKKPIATIAVYNHTGLWAVSVCSKKDQFCKKIGRSIAVKRLLTSPCYFPKVNNYDVLGITGYGTFWCSINDFVWEQLNNVVGDIQANLIEEKWAPWVKFNSIKISMCTIDKKLTTWYT